MQAARNAHLPRSGTAIKMIRFVVTCVLVALVAAYTPANEKQKLPKDLERQVDKLANLISDAYAEPCCQDMQTLKLSDGSELILVMFTVESFGGGNNWTRYMAAFTDDKNRETGKNHYRLHDVVNAGGDAGSQIQTPDAKIVHEDKKDGGVKSVTFSISEWYNADGGVSPKESRRTVYYTYNGLLTEMKTAQGQALPREALSGQRVP